MDRKSRSVRFLQRIRVTIFESTAGGSSAAFRRQASIRGRRDIRVIGRFFHVTVAPILDNIVPRPKKEVRTSKIRGCVKRFADQR